MLEFTPGVTISTLNPYEQRLGSDYIDNLLEIGIILLPELYKLYPSYKIIRAFVPKARLEEEVAINWFFRKFTRGLGITFTWEGWDTKDAIALCNFLAKEYKRKNHYLIDSDSKSITILIKMKDSSISEVFDGKKRKIK